MSNWVAGSVSVLVKPYLSNFTKDIKKELASSGMESVGRDIGEDISNGVKDEAAEGAKDASKQIQKNLKDPLKRQNMGIAEKFKEVGKKAATKFKDTFVRWAKRGLVVGGAAIGVAIGAAVVGGFKSAIDQQQGQLVLEGLYGDAEKAKKTIEELKKVSANSPLEYSSYQAGAESLAYAGVEGQNAIDILENMGSAITASGGDASNMDSATDSILKMVNAGKVNLDSLQQLSNAGIPILSGLSEHYGVSMDEINKMASEGEIGLEDVLSVMENGTGETFEKMIEAGDAASGSFANQWKMAKDNIQVAIGETMVPLIEQLAPLIEPATDALIGFIEKIPGFIDGIKDGLSWVQENSSWLGALAGGLTALGVAALVTAAPGLWAAFTAAVAASPALTALAGAARAAWAAITGPVGLVILAITAIVAALVWFFTQTEIGQQIWEKVWGAIKTAAGAVADWFVNTVWPMLQTAWEGIATGAIWLYQNVILPVWNGIRTAISAVADWIMGTLVPWLQNAWTMIGNAMSWLYNTIILPVWNAIKIAIAIVVTAVLVYIDLWKFYFNNVLAPVFLFLYHNVVLPVWNGIKAAIGATVAWFRDTAWPILSAVINWIRTKFEQFKLGLQIIWNFIKNNVINPVIAWFRDVAWPLLSSVIDWIKNKFELWKQGMKIIWDFIKNSVINPVIAWFRDVAWPLIGLVIDWIKGKFENFKNNLKIIWDFIKNSIINPVLAWFRDTLWPVFRSVLESLRGAFTTTRDTLNGVWDSIKNKIEGVYNDHIKPIIDKFMKLIKEDLPQAFQDARDSIGEIWDKLKGLIATPVEAVVNNVIQGGLIDNFNKVAKWIPGVKKIDDIAPNKDWKAFATGGYTGPGSKYQPAGIVHADEFVIRKESQNSLRRAAPGFLDSLNQHGARALQGMGLGYATGGLVSLGAPFRGSYPRGDGFGARGGKHKGIDWPMPYGTPLIATADGRIIQSYNSAAGNKVTLNHGNGIATTYHHLSRYGAPNGSRVSKGEVVGYVGSTGRSSGPHLHLGVQRNGSYVNPSSYLQGAGAAGTPGAGGGIWNPFIGLWDTLKETVRSKIGEGSIPDILMGYGEKVVKDVGNWVIDKLDVLGVRDEVDAVAGAARWTGVATEALLRENQFGPKRLASLLRRMGQESSYNPRAINSWDSNAAAGNSSRGLMQVIPTTFAAYRDKNLPNDIYDPLANIVSSIRYTLARYGDLEKGWDRKGGYAEGGLVTPYLHDSGGYLQPGLSVLRNKTRRPEPVLSGNQWDAMYKIAENSSVGRDITLNQYINSTNATADAVAAGVSWELRRKGITGR